MDEIEDEIKEMGNTISVLQGQFFIENEKLQQLRSDLKTVMEKQAQLSIIVESLQS